ncbi:MAG: hypothetical protein O7A64_04450 [Alphaproteobacteria bacterium]|nr:hypothetical protein [Alphaproteobacteria bacterium]
MSEGTHWLVRRRSIRVLWIVFVAVLAVLTVADVFIYGHPTFGLDGTFAFYAWYGLLTCVVMILLAKAMGVLLKRKDTYYDGE